MFQFPTTKLYKLVNHSHRATDIPFGNQKIIATLFWRYFQRNDMLHEREIKENLDGAGVLLDM